MKSLQILENTGGKLVAEQTPYTAHFISYAGILIAGIVLVRMLWVRQYKLALIPVIVLVCFAFPLLTAPYPTFHCTVDQQTGTLTSEGEVKGATTSHFTVGANELSSAEMQFNRGARTIVVLRRDGSTLYPLGEQQFQNEPDQYVVLNAIRQMIGQTPAAETSHDSSR